MTEQMTPVPETVIDKIRKVIQDHKERCIGGVTFDQFTARTVVQAYDSLNEKKRERFLQLSPKKMMHKAFQIMEK